MPRRENWVLFAIDLKQAGGGGGGGSGGSGGVFGAGGNAEVSLLMEKMIEFVLSGVSANRIKSLRTSMPAPGWSRRSQFVNVPFDFCLSASVFLAFYFVPSFRPRACGYIRGGQTV